MEQRTGEFIEHLKSLESKEELEATITGEVDQCKSSLQDKGYRFYEVERTDDLVGGQGILSKDINETRYMEEIAHIKRGVTRDEWVHNVEEPDRFNEIRDKVQGVIYGLEL